MMVYVLKIGVGGLKWAKSSVIAFCDVNARRFFILEREGTVHCKRKLEHVGEEWEKGFKETFGKVGDFSKNLAFNIW